MLHSAASDLGLHCLSMSYVLTILEHCSYVRPVLQWPLLILVLLFAIRTVSTREDAPQHG